MRKHFLKVAAASLLACALWSGFHADLARAEAPAPSWTCVPKDTILIIRVPGGNTFIDTLRSKTKLGAVLLSQDRLDKLAAVVKDSGAKWEDVNADLAKYGLKVEDWKDLFAGEFGYAIVLHPRAGKGPLVVGLAWSDPGGDLGDRVIKALQKTIEDHKDPTHPVKRIDTKIEGVDVMQLTTSIMAAAHEAGETDATPDDFDKWKKEDQDKWYADQEKKAKENTKLVEKDQSHFFIARIGTRVIAANTFPTGPHQGGADQKIDLAAESGLEEAKAIFARFIASHSGGGDADSTSKAIMATPGLAAALPAGVPQIEVLFDPRPLVKMAQDDKSPQAAEINKGLTAFGVDKIGPSAIRTTFDNGVLRSGVFSSMPAPRVGIFTLFDQPALPAQPPEWVPTAAITYGQISFDLGKAYTKIREIAVSIGGDQVDQNMQQVEMPVMQSLKTDLPSVLSSLGQRHSVLAFVPKVDEAPADAAGPGGAPGRRPPQPPVTQATALVWQVTNEDLWKQIFQQLSPFAAMAQGAVKPAEEQGFTGFRFKVPGMEGGLFLGKSFLVTAFGSGVVESTLASLRTPPVGADALINSPIYAKSKTLLEAHPGLMYSLVDENRSMKVFRTTMVKNFQFMVDQNHPNEKQKATFEKLKAIIPTEDELDGTMTVGVGDGYMTNDGLIMRGVVEMPAK